MDRRRFVAGAASLAAGIGLGTSTLRPKYGTDRRRRKSRVAVLKAANYTERLEGLLLDGLKLFSLDVQGKAVLLKPNLVEVLPGPVSTHPVLVAAAAQCFLRMGARRVVVAEGPGHERDTEAVVNESGLNDHLETLGIEFVDLNRDELVKTPLRARFSGREYLWLPRTILASDFVVSMPKVKTHHWAGVTLSMKNMFGVVPGMKYGWPKNVLHWHGIHQSIVDICATVPIQFVIADGIVAMEGNGPLQGDPRPLNRIVLADDPVAADATCARLMGFWPERVPHLKLGSLFLGNMVEARIAMLADPAPAPLKAFSVLREFEYLRREHG